MRFLANIQHGHHLYNGNQYWHRFFWHKQRTLMHTMYKQNSSNQKTFDISQFKNKKWHVLHSTQNTGPTLFQQKHFTTCHILSPWLQHTDKKARSSRSCSRGAKSVQGKMDTKSTLNAQMRALLLSITHITNFITHVSPNYIWPPEQLGYNWT